MQFADTDSPSGSGSLGGAFGMVVAHEPSPMTQRVSLESAELGVHCQEPSPMTQRSELGVNSGAT